MLARIAAGDDGGLGASLAETMDKLAGLLVAESKKAGGAELSKLVASRRAAGTMLELAAAAFRDALHLAARADAPPINADQPDAVETLARRFEPAQLAAVIERLSEYEQLLWRNVNPRIVWDNVAITATAGASAPLAD